MTMKAELNDKENKPIAMSGSSYLPVIPAPREAEIDRIEF
jgi:hypothetical protein